MAGEGADKPRGWESWRELWRLPGYVPMMASRASQMFGFSFTPVALQVAAARHGAGEPLVTGAILFASFLPAILLGPPAGVLVERWDKRRTMFGSQLARTAFVLLAVAAPKVWAYVAVSLLMGTAQVFYLPAYRALLPEIARGDDLHMRASGLAQALEQVGSLVGIGLGAFLVVLAGVRIAFLADAAVLGLSALFALRLPPSLAGVAAGAGGRGGIWRPMVEGMRAVGASPLGREIVALVAVFTVGSVMINPLLVLVPHDLLRAPVWWFGVFELAQGAAMAALGGAIAGGLRVRRRLLIAGGFLLSGLSVAALAASRWPLVDLGLYIVFGLANTAWLTPVMALYRLEFPLALRARASAVYSMVMGASQAVGVALGGLVAAALSVQVGLWVSGGWMAAVALAMATFGLLMGADAPATGAHASTAGA
ncbi:MAG: MFS transporter [Firmicutes bacterium]|nr:MFS transporter [Bacillota bacterium]